MPYDDAARVASHIPDELFKGLRYVGTRLGRGLDVGSIPFLRASLALLLGDFALLLLEEDRVLVSVHRGGRASARENSLPQPNRPCWPREPMARPFPVDLP